MATEMEWHKDDARSHTPGYRRLWGRNTNGPAEQDRINRSSHSLLSVHLELTPERILLAEEDKLLICGFSTDKLHYPPEDLTASHDYRAPELASFRGHLGKWTDYYSLGANQFQFDSYFPD